MNCHAYAVFSYEPLGYCLGTYVFLLGVCCGLVTCCIQLLGGWCAVLLIGCVLYRISITIYKIVLVVLL
jgi:hypothetical protein